MNAAQCVCGHATDQCVEGVGRPCSTGDQGQGHGHGQWLAGCLSGSNALLAYVKGDVPHGRVKAGQRRGVQRGVRTLLKGVSRRNPSGSSN